jgi:hypothetical protein
MKKAILILLVLSSCSILDGSRRIKKEMDSFLNQTSTVLINHYGHPYSKTTDGGSGEIWIYNEHIYNPPTTLYASGGVPVTQPSTEYWVYKLFFINKLNIVYNWVIRKEDVPPQRFDVNINHTIRVY